MGVLSRAVESAVINPNFPPLFQRGLPAIGTFALASVIATCTLFAYISYRMITWRRHYRTFVGRNQYLVLVYNLALADLMQALSFTISFYWLQRGEIDSNSNWCFGQGFLVHIGDVSSAFFILAIAVHTWFRVVRNRSLEFKTFLCCVVSIWFFAALLTIIGPISKGKHVFVQSGAWCWINEEYETGRLALHYVWVFIVEFGSFIIYVWIFIYLFNYQRRSGLRDFGRSPANAKKLIWASRAMLAYPVVYTAFTIPLAGGRMALYAGHNIPDVYWICAGCFMTSCGWVDALIYTLTRRVILKPDLSTIAGTNNTNGNRASSRATALLNPRRAHKSMITVSNTIDDKDGFSEGFVLGSSDREKRLTFGTALDYASDELELKAFDETATHSYTVRVTTPPPSRSGKKSPNLLTKRSHDLRSPLSLSRRASQRSNISKYNENNDGMQNGNKANVAAGGAPSLPPINSDGGIIITNDVLVEHNKRSDHRGSNGHDAWFGNTSAFE